MLFPKGDSDSFEPQQVSSDWNRNHILWQTEMPPGNQQRKHFQK